MVEDLADRQRPFLHQRQSIHFPLRSQSGGVHTPRAKTIRSPRRPLFLQRAGLFPLRNGDCRIADRLHRQQAPLSDSDASILSVREFSFADRHFVIQGNFFVIAGNVCRVKPDGCTAGQLKSWYEVI